MGKIKLPHIYFGVLCDAFKVVETVGLVRPQRGGKRGFAARYVISALRPVFTFTKASRNRQNKYGEDKTPPYLFRRFMRRLQSGRDSRARTYDLLHVKQAL